MLWFTLLFCCLNIFIWLCLSANIVVHMALPFYSHQACFKSLWLELAKRGHKITLIQSDFIVENNENITHIILNETYARLNKDGILDRLVKGQSTPRILLLALEAVSDTFEYQLTHPGVQNLLNGNQKVDLLFVEYVVPLGFALASRLNVPTIGIVPMDGSISSHMAIGNPTHPIMYPDKNLAVSPVLTFKDRLSSFIHWLAFKVLLNTLSYSVQERIIRKNLGVATPFEEILKNISLLFINANPLFAVERPLTPSTINLGGGFSLLEPQLLSKDLQDYLDSGEEGVIFFSLGSNIQSKQIPNASKKVILETFAQLPYRILWKLDDEPAGMSGNVKIIKWVPQQDILRHKNIKLFITQGGLQSMEEAIFNYVPMVALPFYGDQPNNANKMVARGFGLALDHTEMTVVTFKNAILEVINNPSYKKITKQLADMVKDQPMTGLENAIFWTEHVLKYGHTNKFRNPSVDIPWYQYLLLDVISFLILVLIVTIYAFIKLVQILVWLIKKFRSIPKKKKSKTS